MLHPNLIQCLQVIRHELSPLCLIFPRLYHLFWMMFPLFRNKNRCSTSKKPPPARFLEFLRQLHVATARLRAQAAGRKTLRRRGSGELEDFQVQSYLHGGLHWYGGWKKMEEIHDQLIGGKHPTIGFQPSLWSRKGLRSSCCLTILKVAPRDALGWVLWVWDYFWRLHLMDACSKQIYA